MIKELQDRLNDPETSSATVLQLTVRLHRVEAIVAAFCNTFVFLWIVFDWDWLPWIFGSCWILLIGSYLVDWLWLTPIVKRQEAYYRLKLQELFDKMDAPDARN